MTTTLMMKDIPITNREYSSYDDEYFFQMFLEHYTSHKQVNINNFWNYKYMIDFEEEEDEDIEDDIEDNNNMNLSLIKKYAPDIYDTYEYDIDDYDNCFNKMYELNLEVCANVLHRRFIDRLFKYINDLEGGDLSGADTDDDE